MLLKTLRSETSILTNPICIRNPVNHFTLYLLQGDYHEENKSLKKRLAKLTKDNKELKIEKAKMAGRRIDETVEVMQIKDCLNAIDSNSNDNVGPPTNYNSSANATRKSGLSSKYKPPVDQTRNPTASMPPKRGTNIPPLFSPNMRSTPTKFSNPPEKK